MQLAQQGKDFGQTTINAGEHKITVDFKKRVEWDQEKLIEAFNQMDPDMARHYATMKYTQCLKPNTKQHHQRSLASCQRLVPFICKV